MSVRLQIGGECLGELVVARRGGETLSFGCGQSPSESPGDRAAEHGVQRHLLDKTQNGVYSSKMLEDVLLPKSSRQTSSWTHSNLGAHQHGCEGECVCVSGDSD